MKLKLASATLWAPGGGRRSVGMAAIGLTAALAYVVVVGGTGSGELNPALRTLNAVIAAAFVFALIVHAPSQADRLDRVLIVAFGLFAVAGALSLFPRQSLDAILAAATYLAALFVARGVLARDAPRVLTMRLLMLLSVGFTVGASISWLPHFIEWWALTGWSSAPRLDLPLPSGPWGYRYDLAVLVVLLYPAWWTGTPSKSRRIVAVMVGLLGLALVLLSGSRTIWLSMAIASLAVGIPRLVATIRAWRRVTPWMVVGAGVLGCAILISGAVRPLAERALSFGAVEWRLAMWEPLADLWLAHLFSGVGPGSFPWALQLTPYFDTNSLAPRHPDSAVVQLLVEAGLLGMISAALVVVAVATAVRRGHSRGAMWALIVGGMTSLGSNPTDFAFLVVVLLAWAAYAAPRTTVAPAGPALPAGTRVASLALAAVVMAAHSLTLLSGFAYEAARTAVERGDLRGARSSLDIAVSLDPGMALYWRQRGVASHYLGDHERAMIDLVRAAELNGEDDLTWRAIALVSWSQGDARGAMQAVDVALQLRRSDPANLLTRSWLLGQAGDDRGAVATLAEVAQGWPAVSGAPGWRRLVPDGESVAVLTDALRRWDAGASVPNHYEGQDEWLGLALARRNVPGDRASVLTRAVYAARTCDPRADRLLQLVGSADRATFAYAETRARAAANRGGADRDAVRGLVLSAGISSLQQRMNDVVNPMNEGSWWGYRRMPIFWPPTEPVLPDPHSGWLHWVLAPRDAVVEAGLGGRLPDCRNVAAVRGRGGPPEALRAGSRLGPYRRP